MSDVPSDDRAVRPAHASVPLPPDGVAIETKAEPTSRQAVNLMIRKGLGFHEPTRKERDALLVGFAMHRRALYGAAYDLVQLLEPVNLSQFCPAIGMGGVNG